jgi:outer membrane protein insertion porin family
LWCVDVLNRLTHMRLSPVLLAFFTASATIGLTNPAEAQTPTPAIATSIKGGGESGGVPSPKSTQFTADARSASALPSEVDIQQRGRASHALPVPVANGVELFPVEFLSQTPAQSPTAPPDTLPPGTPGTPPPGTQTPTEGTDRLEFDITPGSPPGEFEIEPPEEAPPPETTPAPTETAPEIEPTEPVTPEAGPTEPEPTTPEETAAPEPRVLVAEVLVSGAEGDLQNVVYDAISTRPGRTTTRSQLQEDINAVFATGFFANVEVTPEDTPLGVRVTFTVDPNPVLTQVRLQDPAVQTLEVDGEEVPIQQVVDTIFTEQYGQILNFQDLQGGIQQLNQLYQENGYVLAQVIDAPQVSEAGVVTLQVAEGVIEDLEVRFLDEDGNATDEEGNPIGGKTREFIITREFESQPGDVFNQQQAQADLQRVFGLGIFEDVRIALNPGQDPRKVDVIVNVIERDTASLGATVGFGSDAGIFGSVSFQELNLGGNNQRLSAELQANLRGDLLFDLSFTDPWIATDPYRTSYTINAFSRRSISLIFDGGEREVDLPNNDRPRVQRLGGGVSFSRPLDEWLGWEDWRASAGLQYQRVSIRDSDGELSPVDEFGNDLSFSGTGEDDLLLFQLSALRDRRNDRITPTSGSLLRLSTEQSVPIGDGSILLNRLRASYSHYIPVRFTTFTPGCRLADPSPSDCPQTLAFNVQAGTVLGDLPPYEAFALGGTESVRGYESGELGSGRSFLQATVEYRFPVFSIVGGALFFDVGTDLGTGEDVPGEPAEIREKPGSGFGYGAGLRVQTPLGQVRVDFGFNDEGESEFHFGFGERF